MATEKRRETIRGILDRRRDDFAVVVENGGHGGEIAAPVCREILAAYAVRRRGQAAEADAARSADAPSPSVSTGARGDTEGEDL